MQQISLIKKRILQYIDNQGLTKYKFYQDSGITRGVLDKDSGITEDNIAKFIAYAPDVNLSWLILGEGEMLNTKSEEKTNKKNVSINVSENDSIPKVQKTLTNEEIEKGVPVFYKDTAPYKEDYAGIPLIPIDAMAGFREGDIHVMDYETSMYKVPEFEELRTDFMIRVKGSSMYPKYSSGDTVACKKLNIKDIFFQWNKVYVLSTEQGAIIKRVKKGSDDEHILLVSENPSYEPFELHLSQIYAIAIVIGVIRME